MPSKQKLVLASNGCESLTVRQFKDCWFPKLRQQCLRDTLFNFSLSGAFHSMAFRNTALSTDNDSFAITADDVVGNEKTWMTRQQWRGRRWCQGQWREQRPQANLRHMPWPLSGPGDEQVDVSDVGVCTVLMIFMTRVLCLIPYP